MSSDRHGKVQKIPMGNFAQTELAIYGSTCSAVQALVSTFQEHLPAKAIAYLDESHSDQAVDTTLHLTKHGTALQALHPHYSAIGHQALLRQVDLTLINGNHFAGQNQLIVYDAEKETGLLKRAAQLTNVLAFVGPRVAMDRLIGLGLPLANAAHYEHLHDPELWKHLAAWMGSAPLQALLLTGGKSVRMGTDKSLLEHHGQPQYHYIGQLCEQLGLEVMLSCRSEQTAQYHWPQHRIIEDKISDIGAIAGLISAWMSYPTKAWLSIACDMPLLSAKSIAQLIAARQPQRMATTVLRSAESAPEPMLTIWEPKAYPLLMQALSLGITCPRKILQTSNVHSVVAEFPDELFNANTPQELQSIGR